MPHKVKDQVASLLAAIETRSLPSSSAASDKSNNSSDTTPLPAWQLFLAAAVRTAAIYGDKGAFLAAAIEPSCTSVTSCSASTSTTVAAEDEMSEIAEAEKISDDTTCSSGEYSDGSDIVCKVKNGDDKIDVDDHLDGKDATSVKDSNADASFAGQSHQKFKSKDDLSELPSLQLKPGEHFGASEFELLFNWLIAGSALGDGSKSAAPRAVVRQLDWCNSIDWHGAGSSLASAWSGDNTDIADSQNGNENHQKDDKAGNREFSSNSPGNSEDGEENQLQHNHGRDFSHTSTIRSDARFAAFDFVALHHHGRGGNGGGCAAQYCGCCGA